MDKYQNKLNFSFEYYNLILNKISYIDSYKGNWINLIRKKDSSLLKNIEKSALINSLVSSYKMEGLRFSQQQIKEILTANSINKTLTQKQEALISIAKVSDEYFANYSLVELSEKYIKQLYKDLFKDENIDNPHYDEYKKKPNRVVAYFLDGSHKDVFNTTLPYLVEKEMKEILNWAQQQMNSDSLHPLMIIGLFNYEYRLIQPFQYANNRLLHILTRLLLLKSGYSFIKYISFENFMEENKLEYLEALKSGQINRYAYEERINNWLLFFLDSIQNSIIRLEKTLDGIIDKTIYLNERQKKLNSIIRKFQPVKLADLAARMQDVSINTIKKDLQQLKADGIIISRGKNRGTVYSILKK